MRNVAALTPCAADVELKLFFDKNDFLKFRSDLNDFMRISPLYNPVINQAWSEKKSRYIHSLMDAFGMAGSIVRIHIEDENIRYARNFTVLGSRHCYDQCWEMGCCDIREIWCQDDLVI